MKKRTNPQPIHPIDRRPSKRGGRGNPREFTVVERFIESRKRVPLIRMSGRWLQQLGFRKGERIVVTGERDRLVLTVERTE
jgi:hypothetical protein